MPDFTPTPIEWSHQRTTATANRYIAAWEATSPALRAVGAEFFPTWNATAQHIGDHLGQTLVHGAAILAHLSPANEAEANRLQALYLVHNLDDDQLRLLTCAGNLSSQAVSAAVEGRRVEAALRRAARLTARVKRLRAEAGIGDTPLNQVGSRELRNAALVVLGAWDDPLESLKTPKLRSFALRIIDPYGLEIPVDTHYHDAGVGRLDIPYLAERGLSAKRRYAAFQAASIAAWRRAAPRIAHSEFMAGIWYGHQQRKADRNAESNRTRKASETRLTRFHEMIRAEDYGLAPSFAKIAV